ncbi:MAG: carbon-nitrogen family hydrolase [Halobacteriota archaeon]
MKLALAQLTQSPGDVGSNLSRAESAIDAAAEAGADVVALPELFNVGYFGFESYARRAESLDGPTLERLREEAVARDIALLAGSVVEDLEASAAAGFDVPTASGLANTSVFFDRTGGRLGVYRKHHLFGYGSEETRLVTPGERVPTFEFEGFTVGITICYDLRFPELYRELAEAGATLVFVPSAWPYPRVEHWTTLGRARAIENQLYLAAVNGVGDSDETRLLGRSTVYDPWGVSLASAGDDDALVTARVDPGRVDSIRDSFPAWADRRR